MGPLSIEQVLAAEAAAIHDLSDSKTREIVENLTRLATTQGLETNRADKDADQRSGKDEYWRWIENRKKFYCELGKLKRAALCCSGGGIRSATFCLGIIQALATYKVAEKPSAADTATTDTEVGVPDQRSAGNAAALEIEANQSLLSHFHYLSTVSGGGYIGSWLSAWRSRDDFPTVWQSLRSRPEGPDVEPPEISWLRAYSNFLTPRVGLVSADTWTGIAIYLRNLLLNWLVIVPAIAIVLLVFKFFITGAVQVARLDDYWFSLHLAVALVGFACLIVAQAFTTGHRPTRRPPPPADCITDKDPHNATQRQFQFHNLIWSVASAFCVTAAATSKTGVLLAGSVDTPLAMLGGAVLAVPVFALGWLAGRPYNWRCRDFWMWVVSGLIYGGLVGLGAHLFTLMLPYTDEPVTELSDILVPVIFGLPWVLLAQLLADMIFVGLVSYENNSDSDREWLGRAAGWFMASGVIWIATTFITFAGGYFLIDYFYGQILAPYIAGAGGISGAVAAWIAKKGNASKAKAGEKGEGSIWSKIGLAIAGPLFAAVLVVGISVGLDLLLLEESLTNELVKKPTDYGSIYTWLVIGAAATLFVAVVASRSININRFSIHALYRNRLVRAYLGASRQQRCPDLFTGFDTADNPKMYTIWPPKPYKHTGGNSHSLFHVVNITLNVVKATRLAWQQRKAESFTVSPLHSGAAYKGYRPSDEYGGDAKPPGISLGTAMAVSGAAASPNMGYHSNPSTAILLALFNVRLGWWLGNPGKEGKTTYRKEGPSTAIVPLAQETFGLTTDDKPWVYLSDGGHFENLGIYEMVRRRCRFIVAIDAGCDPEFKYEDLGNAVRKTYIDLGVRIKFPQLDRLLNRPAPVASNKDIPYYAIGTIYYKDADGDDCDNGTILYIKPAYHGVSAVEGAGVRSYAEQSKEFPHESTGDQWFTESQFESYRALALSIADTIFNEKCELTDGKATLKVAELMAGLSKTARNQTTPDAPSPGTPP